MSYWCFPCFALLFLVAVPGSCAVQLQPAQVLDGDLPDDFLGFDTIQSTDDDVRLFDVLESLDIEDEETATEGVEEHEEEVDEEEVIEVDDSKRLVKRQSPNLRPGRSAKRSPINVDTSASQASDELMLDEEDLEMDDEGSLRATKLSLASLSEAADVLRGVAEADGVNDSKRLVKRRRPNLRPGRSASMENPIPHLRPGRSASLKVPLIRFLLETRDEDEHQRADRS